MKKIIFLILIGIMSLASCTKEILNKMPLDSVSDNVLWTDPALIDAFMTQAYAQMYILTSEVPGNDWNTSDEWFPTFYISELSDECREVWGDLNPKYKTGGLKIDGGILEWWETSYNVIRKLNEFIERVPTAPVAEDFKMKRTAEARFLRAFNYFAMVKRYGGVPLVTKVLKMTDPKDDLYPKRANEQAVYDFIISEMDAILSDLSLPAYSETGRPTNYSALALKCRAALYAGSIAQFGTVQLDGVVGIDASKRDSYYQAAYDAAKVIVDSKKYELYNSNPDKIKNFHELFIVKDNKEVIFARKHDFLDKGAGGSGWSYDFLQCPFPNAWGAGNACGPYLEMAEEFEHIDGTTGKLDRAAIQQGLWTAEDLWANKDPRFFATIYTQGTPWKGSKIDYHYGILKPDGTVTTETFQNVLALGAQSPMKFPFPTTGFGVLKYCDETKDNTGNRGTSGVDYIVFRYGEILLNMAEAAFELGKSAEALDAINQIRNRAGIAALSSVDRDKIRHERKVELAFEAHRYWDARRWRTAVTDFSKNNSALRYILDFTSGKFKLQVVPNIDGVTPAPAFFTQNYYLPITLARTGSNSNLVENPGY